MAANSSLYYRVEVKGVASPLRCEINYTNISAKVSHLDIFISTECKEPTFSDHEMRFRGNNPKFFIPATKIGSTNQEKIKNQIANQRGTSKTDKSKAMFLMMSQTTSTDLVFQDQYLYIGFNSELQPISFTIVMSPIESRQNLNKVKLEQHKRERQDLLNNIEKVIKADRYYEDMLQLKSEQRAFIQKHREFLQKHGYGIYYPDEQRDAQKFKNHKQKLMQGSIRKDSLEIQHRKMKLFQLVKWQHLRAYKEEQLDQSVAKYRGIKYRALFVKHLRMHTMMKKINQVYLAEKQERKKQMIAFFLAVQYKAKFVKRMRCRGHTVMDRIRTCGRNCLTFVGNATVDAKMEVVKPIFGDFLKEWSALASMVSHFDDLIDVLKFMVGSLERTYKVRKQQEHCITDHLWGKKRSELLVILTHRLATEKQKQLHAKILKVKDTVADADVLCKEGSDEYQALPLERKVKKVVVGAYILR